MTGKRVSLGSLAGAPPPPEMRRPQVADAPPKAVPVDLVAPNPLNPRKIDPESRAVRKIRESIAEHGQIELSTVVTRRAFLAIHSEHESTIGDAPYVQVVGGQRRAAVAGLGQPLKIAVDDDFAATRAKFLGATLAENFKRQNLNPIEEAHGVRDMVAECGSQKTAAQQIGFTAAWVTQRLNLLKLIPEVQAALNEPEPEEDDTGQPPPKRLTITEVRDWHTLDTAGQLAALARWRHLNTPKPAEDSPTPGSRPRSAPVSRYAAAIRRLGETPQQVAANLYAEMQRDQVEALLAELTALTKADR